MANNEGKKRLPLPIKIPFIGIASLAGVFVLVWASINIFKYPFYCDFYNSKVNAGAIPGINDGMVQQGITVNDSDGSYLVSTYHPNQLHPSRVYTVLNNRSTYVDLFNQDGTNYYKHSGGIQYVNSKTYGEYIFIADAEEGLYCLSYSDFSSKMDENKAVLGKCVTFSQDDILTNECSFVYSDDTYLYVGEFNDEQSSEWKAHNLVEYNGVTHQSLIFRFNLDDFITNYISYNSSADNKFVYPDYVAYSIMDDAQGCVFKDNSLFLSCSYSIAHSHLYHFDISNCPIVSTSKYGDVYFVSAMKKDMWMPPMSEELDLDDRGRIVTLTESASDKYIFGKLFFAFNIWAITI